VLADVGERLERDPVEDRPDLRRRLALEAVVHPPVEAVVAERVGEEQLERGGEPGLVERRRA
jgi:hypothetical protein